MAQEKFIQLILYSQTHGRIRRKGSDLFRVLEHDGQSDSSGQYCNHTIYKYTDQFCAPWKRNQ